MNPFDHAYMNGVWSHQTGAILKDLETHPGESLELQRLHCTLLAAILDELKDARAARELKRLENLPPLVIHPKPRTGLEKGKL